MRACAVVLVVLAWSGPARAVEPVLEVHGFLKALGGGVRLDDGLVQSSDALDELLAEARAQAPQATLPAPAELPRYGGLAAQTARAWGQLILGEHLELQAGYQLESTVASDRALVGQAPGIAATQAPATRAARRLVDVDPTLAATDRYLLQQNLDLLAVKAHLSAGDLVVGRQVLSWGSGRLWNPTDLLSPFAPTDVDREVRHGVDAVRLSVPLGVTSQADFLWLAQPEAREQGAVARVVWNVAGFDLAPSFAKYARDLVAGLDVAGDLGPAAVHLEAAFTHALDENPDGTRDEFLRAVAGADVQPASRLVLTAEYYFNGWGAVNPSDYLSVLRSDRERRGEVFGAGRHYLGLVAAWQISELVTAGGTAIVNLTDPSMVLVPSVAYWAEQSVLLRVYGSIPAGAPPDPAAIERLTPEDALDRTDAFRRSAGSLGLQSEYGAAALGLFVQVGVYFG